MNPQTLETLEEQGLVGKFEQLLGQLRQIGHQAPDGQVIDQMESLLMSQGRDLLRLSLETQLQAAAQAAEKKGARPAPAARKPRKTKGLGRKI